MLIWKKILYTKIPYDDKNFNKNKFWLSMKVLCGLKQTKYHNI